MQGCGNDYIFIDCLRGGKYDFKRLSALLSDRHKGVGGDGLIAICGSSVADAKMRIFNLDGSEGKMCGNGLRCFGKYLFDSGIVKSPCIKVETLSGVKTIRLYIKNGKAVKAKINMGTVETDCRAVPVFFGEKSCLGETVRFGGENYDITAISVGNPHCVIFTENAENFPLEKVYKEVVGSGMFPDGVNLEAAELGKTIKMRVFERGSGETMSCGTGACAVAAAAVIGGYRDYNKTIKISLRGGTLEVTVTKKNVYLCGDCKEVFRGELNLENFK